MWTKRLICHPDYLSSAFLTEGRLRSDCDYEFYQNLRTSCRHLSPKKCESMIKIAYAAVQVFGRKHDFKCPNDCKCRK